FFAGLACRISSRGSKTEARDISSGSKNAKPRVVLFRLFINPTLFNAPGDKVPLVLTRIVVDAEVVLKMRVVVPIIEDRRRRPIGKEGLPSDDLRDGGEVRVG